MLSLVALNAIGVCVWGGAFFTFFNEPVLPLESEPALSRHCQWLISGKELLIDVCRLIRTSLKKHNASFTGD